MLSDKNTLVFSNIFCAACCCICAVLIHKRCEVFIQLFVFCLDNDYSERMMG